MSDCWSHEHIISGHNQHLIISYSQFQHYLIDSFDRWVTAAEEYAITIGVSIWAVVGDWLEVVV